MKFTTVLACLLAIIMMARPASAGILSYMFDTALDAADLATEVTKAGIGLTAGALSNGVHMAGEVVTSGMCVIGGFFGHCRKRRDVREDMKQFETGRWGPLRSALFSKFH